jgi:hypothetical protein
MVVMDQIDVIDQMDGANDSDDDKLKRPSLRPSDIALSFSQMNVTSSDHNKSQSFPESTKLALSNISRACWLCAALRYEVAHVLGRDDTSVLLLPRT